MDLLKCRALLNALELGSILAASEKMDYTPSGINRMINALEEELGVTLLNRNRHGVTLTSNGESLLPLLRQFIKSGEQIEQRCSELNGLICGELRIGSFYSVASHKLPKLIKKFICKYPGIQIHIEEDGMTKILSMLKENRLDCCFSIVPDDSDVDFIPLFEDRVVVWLPKHHLFAKSEAFPVHLLADYPYISMVDGKNPIVNSILNRYNLTTKTCYTTQDSYTAFRMVEAGLGISANNELTCEKWDGDVTILPFDPPQQISIGLALPKNQKLSPVVSRFTEFIKREWN
ncbi:LysR family transcriptional regulator [Ihubacter sp. mB4P-1]|uniref:LysR family transcriptional regulator n=1 Tax=Ihubacter sp. mB4P-1 TaxID=3242370 RepID=UPI003C7E1110